MYSREFDSHLTHTLFLVRLADMGFGGYNAENQIAFIADVAQLVEQLHGGSQTPAHSDRNVEVNPE